MDHNKDTLDLNALKRPRTTRSMTRRMNAEIRGINNLFLIY